MTPSVFFRHERPTDTLAFDTTLSAAPRLDAPLISPYYSSAVRPLMGDPYMLAYLTNTANENCMALMREDPSHDLRSVMRSTEMNQSMLSVLAPQVQHSYYK